MCRYYMELPSSDYVTIQIAYDYIKRNFPYLTKGFRMAEELIDNFRTYPEAVFYWYSDESFLGWGIKRGGTKIPFPDIDCIVLGEIEYEESCL